MAAQSLQPAELSEAAEVRTLMRTMERNRLRRLRSCGFAAVTARHLSDLHPWCGGVTFTPSNGPRQRTSSMSLTAKMCDEFWRRGPFDPVNDDE